MPLMEDKLYRDEAWLREQYSVNKRSSINIALEAECSFSTILFWLDKFGIPRNDYTNERRSRQIEYNKTRIFSEKTRKRYQLEIRFQSTRQKPARKCPKRAKDIHITANLPRQKLAKKYQIR